MKLALDAMGGDYAPQEIVMGGLDALNQYDYMEKLYLVGKRDAIEAVLKDAEKNQKIDYSKIEIVEASEVIEMDDHPATAYRRKKRCIDYSGDSFGKRRDSRCSCFCRQYRWSDGICIIWSGSH